MSHCCPYFHLPVHQLSTPDRSCQRCGRAPNMVDVKHLQGFHSSHFGKKSELYFEEQQKLRLVAFFGSGPIIQSSNYKIYNIEHTLSYMSYSTEYRKDFQCCLIWHFETKLDKQYKKYLAT